MAAAQYDWSPAFFELARRYDDGDGVAPSAERAATWYTQAAADGVLEAQVRIADRLERAHGCARSDEALMHNLRAAAAQGHRESRVRVAMRLQHACGVAVADRAEALDWWQRVVDGDTHSATPEQQRAPDAQPHRQIGTLCALAAVHAASTSASASSSASSSAPASAPASASSSSPLRASAADVAWSASFTAFAEAASRGCLAAQLAVADAYASGWRGVRRNVATAARHWRHAALDHYRCATGDYNGVVHEEI